MTSLGLPAEIARSNDLDGEVVTSITPTNAIYCIGGGFPTHNGVTRVFSNALYEHISTEFIMVLILCV